MDIAQLFSLFTMDYRMGQQSSLIISLYDAKR
jgi:hypothetical protein